MKNDYFKIITISLAAGLFAGIAGGILLVYSFNWYLDSTSLLSPRFLQSSDSNQVIAIRDSSKNVVIEQDESLVEVIAAAKAYTWGIYKQDKELTLVGQAVALTSDGWLVAKLPKDTKEADILKFKAVDKDKKSVAIKKVIFDELSGFYFLSLADTKNINVAKLGAANSVSEGHLLTSVGWLSGSENYYLNKKSRSGGLLSSEKSSLNLGLSGKVQADKLATLNLYGEIVALINDQGVLVPMESISGVMSTLLAGGQPTRPYLGVYYVDLSQKIGQGELKGALLSKNEAGEVMAADSPLQKSGLKSGDIILSIDNNEIDKDKDLTDILCKYKPGDKIYIRYKRGDKEEIVEVLLGKK